MILLEKNNLDDLLNSELVLVDFYASWCVPCKMLEHILEELDNKISIIKVDVDKFKNIALKYRIMSVPTIIFFKDKNVVKEVVGFHSKEELEKIITEI